MLFYRPDFIPNKIIIIGCGGTGSRLVPLLSQFIKTCNWVSNPEMVLIDDDVVETKNLARQNFIKPDVDKYKAVVLANRYSKAFDLQITPITARVNKFNRDTAVGYIRYDDTPEDQELKLQYETFQRFNNNSIIILCVDSPEARRDILGHLMFWRTNQGGTSLLIDAGNENDFGQVTCSTLHRPNFRSSTVEDLPKNLPGDLGLPCIPTDMSYFKTMTAISAGSCADLDQTMAINTAMATTIFGLVQNFYYAKPISYHRIDVSLSHGSIPQYMNLNWLKNMKDQDHQLGEYSLLTSDCTNAIAKFRREVYDPFMEQVRKAEEAAARAEKLKAASEAAIAKAKKAEEAIAGAVNSVDADGNAVLLGSTKAAKPKRKTTTKAGVLTPAVLSEEDLARIASITTVTTGEVSEPLRRDLLTAIHNAVVEDIATFNSPDPAAEHLDLPVGNQVRATEEDFVEVLEEVSDTYNF